jgi:serine/threonine protein kinase/tetratricopeptide (TPR) repeat protein
LADRYAVESEIGRGGMATVFLAEDLRHGRKVAIKVLHPELAATVGADRFLREIELVARLNHPHILPLHDSGEADGLLYYVMPFVEGESLAERLEREKQLPLEEVLRITSEVALGLDFAHEHGVLHRDIKPANILLSSAGVVIADFGIGKAIDSADAERLTKTGLVAGTPAYMSPEQGLGDGDIDGRSDTYSLACVTYEMLAGEPPFAGPTPQAVQARRAAGEVPSLSIVRDSVSGRMEAVILKALSRAPADRYPTSGAFAEALAHAAAGDERTSAGRRIRRTIVAAVLIVGFLLVSSVLWLTRTRSGDQVAPPPEAEEGPAVPSVAVLPFNVSGTGFEHLSEGMIELVYANLEGMTNVRPVSPSTVLARWNESVPEDVEPDLLTMLDVAAASGAQYAVRGSVVAAGPLLRFTASVYETSGTDALGQATESAYRDSSFTTAVDQLSIGVLRAIGKTGAGELAGIDLRDVTTDSPDALRAFLLAQAAYRRAEFETAAAEYKRAIAEDSTFSLAYLGLGWSSMWNSGRGGEALGHWQAAIRHAANERQDLLARASLSHDLIYERTDVLEELRQAVRDDPDDALLWYLLGEHYLHVGTASGAFDDYARHAEDAFERAVSLVPDFAPYRFHLIDLAINRADSVRAAELIAELEHVAPDAREFGIHYRVAFHASPDRPGLQADLDTLEQLGALDRTYETLLGHPRLWPAARAVIERKRADPLGRDCGQMQHSLAVGRYREFLAEAAAPPGESSCLYVADLLGLPVSEAVLDSVMDARLGEIIRTGEKVEGASVSAWNLGLFRDFGVPVLLANRGRWAAYDSVLSIWSAGADLALSQQDLFAELFLRQWVRMLEAYALWARGEPEQAVETLEDVNLYVRFNSPDARWWLANLYVELDRPADAARQYRTLQGVYGFGAPNWTPAYFRLGEVYEQLGEPELAREQYAYVVDAWAAALGRTGPGEDRCDRRESVAARAP